MSTLSLDAHSARIAAGQHGLVTHRQLTEIGMSRQAIYRRVQAGGLIRLLPQVFALAAAPNGWQQRVMSVYLWAGPASTITGWAAAALHRLEGFPDKATQIEVMAGRSLRRAAPWIRVRRLVVPHRERQVIARIPVTDVARTLIELAPDASEELLELAFEGARRRRSVQVADVERRLAQLPSNKAGRDKLARILDAHRGNRPSDSALEVKVEGLLLREGYPPPVRQQVVSDRGEFLGRVDLMYPERRLVLEVDGFAYHDGRRSFDRDRQRRNALSTRGLLVLQVTSAMLKGAARERFLRDLHRAYHRPLGDLRNL